MCSHCFKLWNNCMNHNFYMTTNAEFHLRTSRQSNLIHFSDQHIILNDMISLYNNLNDNLKDTHNLSQFKEKSKIYLINICR